MNPTEAGQTQVFTGTIAPAGAAFPVGTTFTVTPSDTSVPVSVDSDGLAVTIGPYPAGFVDNPASPFNVVWATSTFTPVPAGSPSSLTETITPSVPPPPPTPTPTGITFVQTT